MARAQRHYIPDQIWHITHRCHKREFLLKFSKDRKRWLQWLYEAKKRYGLVILNYAVTSNHIHLLVVGNNERDVIPNSIKLIAGRTGQEFNQRKRRKGRFGKIDTMLQRLKVDNIYLSVSYILISIWLEPGLLITHQNGLFVVIMRYRNLRGEHSDRLSKAARTTWF